MSSKEKLLASAQKFLAKGQLPKAIGEYQKLVEAFPKDVNNRQKLAELLRRAERNDEALAEYEAVAKHYTVTGFYLKAIAVFKQMQKLEPSRVDIYHRLAELNEKQGLLGNALTEYRNLVSFYEQNDMNSEAADVLLKMVGLDPDNLNVRAKLTECLQTARREDEAYEQFLELIGHLRDKQDASKLIKLYDRFHELCPETAEARLPLADALLASGQTEKAVQILKSILKADPDNLAILSSLVDCYFTLEDFANARLTCQHLLKAEPDDLDVREKFVRICLAAGEFERALDCLEEWKDAFSQASRFDFLRASYAAVQVPLPDDARVGKTLAAIYEALGEPATGQETAATDETEPPVETADAAILDEAISDVESFDMVGEEAAPDIEVPPLGENAPAAGEGRRKKTVALELDLDLDLDLDLSAVPDSGSEPEPVEASVVSMPAVEEPVAAPPEVEPPATGETELEIDLDLGALDFEVETETETAAEPEPAEESAAELPSEEPAAELPSEEPAVELPSEEPAVELPSEEVEISFASDLATSDLSLDAAEAPMEPAVGEDDEAEAARAQAESEFTFSADEEPLELAAAAGADEPDSELVAGELVLESAAPDESIDDHEPLEELEELEEIEELEEVEPLDELAEIAGADDLEPIEELEEIEELEPLEEAFETEGVNAVSGFAAALNVEAELEEAEFYLQQGLYDDAERVVRTLQEYRPELPELQDKLDEIGTLRSSQAAGEGDVGVFADLMADLDEDELFGSTDFLGSSAGATGELTQELATELDSEDTESHYNLGIAYKEMGLFDDAIEEFDKAAKDLNRRLDCLTLKGQCQAEAGDFATAEQTFKAGLALDALKADARMTLHFELGLLFEASARPLEALESFQVVADRDAFFRDVGEKVGALRRELKLDDQSGGDAAKGDRSRVSYV